jgi:hypothetical protein
MRFFYYPQEKKRVRQLTQLIADLVSDHNTFALLVLTLLTERFVGKPARLHRQYASMYRRHVLFGGCADEEFMLAFTNGISQVRELSQLMTIGLKRIRAAHDPCCLN